MIYLTNTVSNFYLPLEQAIDELKRRKQSKPLLNKVRSEINLTPELEVLFEKPHLIMFRQVLSPLRETALFFELAKKYDISPLVIEYHEDKFVSTGNPFKRGLGKLPLYKSTAANGQIAFSNRTVVDFNKYVGQPLSSVLTFKDEPLVDLHHQLFFETHNIDPTSVSCDGTNWFRAFSSAEKYYGSFLKIFVRDAILFETFLETGQEKEFTQNTVLPAFNACMNEFKCSPLVTMATYEDSNVDAPDLDYYPDLIGEILTKKGYN